MRKLTAFNFISLNGFFKGPDNDISWHKHGEEESDYSAEAMQKDNILLFGRITYQMMANFWPTPFAMEKDPRTARGMNNAEKIVFSNTLSQNSPTIVAWNKTTVVSGDIVTEVRKIKEAPGKDMTILGSGSIISQFAEHGLIDEYQIMVDPVALVKGTPMFDGITQQLDLKFTGTRTFKSGTVLLNYER